MSLGVTLGGIVRKVGGGGVTVVVIPTVSELNATAGAGDLSNGYYLVPNVGVTYWDGFVFFPYLTHALIDFAVPLNSLLAFGITDIFPANDDGASNGADYSSEQVAEVLGMDVGAGGFVAF